MGLDGLILQGLAALAIEEVLAYSMQEVNRLSAPSDMKIKDMRITEITDAIFKPPLSETTILKYPKILVQGWNSIMIAPTEKWNEIRT